MKTKSLCAVIAVVVMVFCIAVSPAMATPYEDGIGERLAKYDLSTYDLFRVLSFTNAQDKAGTSYFVLKVAGAPANVPVAYEINAGSNPAAYGCDLAIYGTYILVSANSLSKGKAVPIADIPEVITLGQNGDAICKTK